MSFIQLKELLGRAANQWNMKRSISASMVCSRYRLFAPRVIRPDILDFSAPRYFKNNILVVGAENSAWAQEIFLHKEALRELINSDLGGEVVKDIRVQEAGQ